jgi:transcriptional regulator with XRE-family HTH domain
VQPTGDAGRELARRLRMLRDRSRLTQAQLAEGLSVGKPVSVPAISSWESQRNPQIPAPNRLEAYARFFATQRSLSPDGTARLLTEGQLTAEEQERRRSLLAELMELRAKAMQDVGVLDRMVTPGGSKLSAIGGGTWHFPDQRDITIVCAPLSKDHLRRIPYADPESPHYCESYRYADLDALIELHGHLRAVNPLNQVNVRLATELAADDLTTHLILLGGVDWNSVTRELQRRLDLPVRQVSNEADEGAGWEAWFEVDEGHERQEFRPLLAPIDGHQVLLEDVAHFLRSVSPFNKLRTITLCNGVHGRGTYGAVRVLTDAKFRDRNEEYVASRFKDSNRFSVLMRVQVVNNQVITPDWTQADMRLHEWPEAGR